MSLFELPFKIRMLARFAISPMIAMTSISRPSTSFGSNILVIDSYIMMTATPSRKIPFTKAASISAL